MDWDEIFFGDSDSRKHRPFAFDNLKENDMLHFYT